MLEDNVYAKSTERFLLDEPEEQVKERETEQNAVFSELPIIQAVIDRMQARADHYDTVSAIPTDIRLDKEKLAIRIEANTETKANLEQELQGLIALVREHTER